MLVPDNRSAKKLDTNPVLKQYVESRFMYALILIMNLVTVAPFFMMSLFPFPISRLYADLST